MDYVLLLLMSLLLLTVYRIGPLVKLLYVNWHRCNRTWLRHHLTRNLLLVAQHTWKVCQILLCTVLIFATLVRAVDWLENLARCWSKGLEKIRQEALFEVSHICSEMCQLCTLMTVWKTYELLFKALVFMAMLPAACCHSVITVMTIRLKDLSFCVRSTRHSYHNPWLQHPGTIEPTEQRLQVGCTVTVYGLTKDLEFNGMMGHVESIESSGKYTVTVCDAFGQLRKLRLTADNLLVERIGSPPTDYRDTMTDSITDYSDSREDGLLQHDSITDYSGSMEDGLLQHNTLEGANEAAQKLGQTAMLRVTISTVTWFIFCVFIVLSSLEDAPITRHTWFHLLLGFLAALLALNALLLVSLPEHCWENEWQSPVIRYSWSNFIALFGTFVQSGVLVLLGIGTLGRWDQPNLQHRVADALLDSTTVWATVAVTSLWVIVASLSWVVSEKTKFQQSHGFVFLATTFRELLVLPACCVLGLQSRAALNSENTTIPGYASTTLLVFLVVISQMGMPQLRGCAASIRPL